MTFRGILAAELYSSGAFSRTEMGAREFFSLGFLRVIESSSIQRLRKGAL